MFEWFNIKTFISHLANRFSIYSFFKQGFDGGSGGGVGGDVISGSFCGDDGGDGGDDELSCWNDDFEDDHGKLALESLKIPYNFFKIIFQKSNENQVKTLKPYQLDASYKTDD